MTAVPLFTHFSLSSSLPAFMSQPLLLHNSFKGTGKSVTGAHIAYVFAKLNKTLNTADSHQCVLYCGPSNKSVDVVFGMFSGHMGSYIAVIIITFFSAEEFSKFLEARESLDVKILRIYSSAVERRDYPGPKLENQYTPTLTKCQAWAKPYALHHMIRDRRRTEPEFRELADLEETLEKTVPSGMICNHYRNVLKKAEEKLLQTTKFDVIFCTCNEASGARVRKNVSPRQCIIDECGMAYEPETIVPIGLCEHAVLIGDHKQLQPVIKYRYASENGLATSLFERYAMNFIGYMFTLKTQYRMVSTCMKSTTYHSVGPISSTFSVPFDNVLWPFQFDLLLLRFDKT